MKRKRRFKHLNQSDRDRLEILRLAGYRQVEIAKVLKVNKSTISREIRKRKRKNGIYDAATAQHKARIKRSNSKYQGMKVESDAKLKKYIIRNLKKYRSPDEIAGRMKREGKPFYAGKKAIYKWLYSSPGDGYCKYLCTRRHRRKMQKRDKPKRVMIPNRIPISERPTSFNHWEGDTMLSPKKAQTTASVAMVCGIDTKYISGTKIPSLKPKIMKQAIRKFNSQVDMESLTLDNGIENRYHEQFGISAYFCNPHSPWQKPHVENSIGLLRRWFLPKGTDLSKVSEKELQRCILILNRKYRKSLGYQSAYEVAMGRGILKTKQPLRVAFR